MKRRRSATFGGLSRATRRPSSETAGDAARLHRKRDPHDTQAVRQETDRSILACKLGVALEAAIEVGCTLFLVLLGSLRGGLAWPRGPAAPTYRLTTRRIASMTALGSFFRRTERPRGQEGGQGHASTTAAPARFPRLRWAVSEKTPLRKAERRARKKA